MNLPRHAIRAFKVRSAYALEVAAPPIYIPLRFNSTTISRDEDNQKPSKKSKKAKKGASSPSADAIRGLMRLQPHGLAAVVAPSEFPRSPIALNRPKSNFSKAFSDTKSALLVSSLNTVTLSPIPYVSLNIKTPSETYQRIRDFGSFMVSGLGDSKTAQAFVKEGGEDERKYSTVAWSQFVGETGIVRPEYGGTWWLKCKYIGRYSVRVGDHVIVVAEVLEAGGGRISENESDRTIPNGLVYLDGEYRCVGDRMPPIIKQYAKMFQREGKDSTIPREEKPSKGNEAKESSLKSNGSSTIRYVYRGTTHDLTMAAPKRV